MNCCSSCNWCCPALGHPKGIEWDNAAPGFKRYLREAADIALNEEENFFCGCCADVSKMKAALEAAWLPGAQDYLADFGLGVNIHAFISYNGNSTSPHLQLQFYKTSETESAEK